MRKSILAVAAAVSMIGLSSGALAQSAAPLSLAHARIGADLNRPSDLRGGFIIPTLIVVAIVVGVYLLTKDDNPASP
jgi:hypothetical protein